MTYRVNRALGYQKWGVTNPWVFVDPLQPQRGQSGVSPMVFKTEGAFLKSRLGDTETHESREVKRGERMEMIALAGLVLSVGSFLMAYNFYSRHRAPVSRNRRRRRRSRR